MFCDGANKDLAFFKVIFFSSHDAHRSDHNAFPKHINEHDNIQPH